MVIVNKNRNRKAYSFANINLLGKCNADCYFCLGKDIKQELYGKNQLNTHFHKWLNFELFLQKCKDNSISKLYLTGQTADGLQYKYLDEIVDYLQESGFIVGVRTNGYLAEQKIHCIEKMRGEIGYSMHSLNSETNLKMMHKHTIPNWNIIIPVSGDNVRIAIVITRHNVTEIDELLKYISTFRNVRYIQLRRISTDTRLEFLQEDIDCFENFYSDFASKNKQIGEYCLAQQFNIYDKQVVFWRTVETNCNSLNYFTDGTCSDEYFIVEGYLNNYKNK